LDSATKAHFDVHLCCSYLTKHHSLLDWIVVLDPVQELLDLRELLHTQVLAHLNGLDLNKKIIAHNDCVIGRHQQ